jgi:ribosomal protein S18 acetylase RimI-like enzyme
MPNASKLPGIKIRRAKSSDATRLAALSTELGYPATSREMKSRLSRLKPASDNAVFVAENDQREVVGWLHVSVTRLLEVPLRAEVNGLIVSEAHRSKGAGAELLQAGVSWAQSKKCASMSVRSNVIRERAHQFYERHGFEHYKTQKAFRKPLGV